MSGQTTTIFEELYCCSQAATTTTPTAGAVSMIAGWPSMEIWPAYFTRQGKFTSSCKLKLRGQMTTTATIPTWQFGVAWTQAMPATFSAANVLAASAARTPGNAQTGAWFDLELDISLRTLGLGATSALLSAGFIQSEALMPAAYTVGVPNEWSIPATGSTGISAASIDVDQPIFLWPYLTLGAATAGNTVTSQMGKIYGEN